jgi:transcriptional regulator with XRE-family HTH domain
MQDRFPASAYYGTFLSCVKDEDVQKRIGYVRSMGKEGESGPEPTDARSALAHNLRDLMKHYRMEGGFEIGISSRQLEAKCGVSYKTIDRMLNPYTEHGPNFDSLDTVAAFFKVPTWKMLVPRPEAPALSGEARPTREGALNSVRASTRRKRTGG